MIHEAFVREVRPFGVLVEIPNLQVRGMVRTPDFPLARDGRRLRWNYNMGAKRWDSTGGEELKPGSRLEVIPVKVDFTARWIDLSARFLKE